MNAPAAAPDRTTPDRSLPDRDLPDWSIVDLPAVGEHRATVFLLHGLGADGHDLAPVVPALRLPASLGVRFRFPEAPRRPVTVNGGFVMRAWYDIPALDGNGRAHPGHLREAVAGTRALIAAEIARGIPAERIVLAGFSQGGAVALAAATGEGASGEPRSSLAGVAALSTYLPAGSAPVPARDGAAPPVFMAHGEHDDLVPYALGVGSRDRLRAAGWEVEFHSYPIAHAISPEEIHDLGRFLRRALGGDPA